MARGISAMFGGGPARFGAAVKPSCPYRFCRGWVCENHPHLPRLRAANAGPVCRASATGRKDTKSRILPTSCCPGRDEGDAALLPRAFAPGLIGAYKPLRSARHVAEFPDQLGVADIAARGIPAAADGGAYACVLMPL
jgi:hypothetical protein